MEDMSGNARPVKGVSSSHSNEISSVTFELEIARQTHTHIMVTSQVPINNKKIRPDNEVIDDETHDDEIAVKAVSNFLAHMTGCWDPEFKPSVEEIMEYR